MQCRLQDKRRRPDERTVDCEECQNGSNTVAPKFNRQRGRYCYKFSDSKTRSDLIKIETEEGKFSASNREGLISAIHALARWQKQEGAPADLESIMKGLGMCIWSWPFSEQDLNAYKLLQHCTGGMAATLPHPELGYEDQPNLYFEYLETYLKARSDYQERFHGPDT